MNIEIYSYRIGAVSDLEILRRLNAVGNGVNMSCRNESSIGVGLALGLVFGILYENIVLGIAIGLALSAGIDKSKNKRNMKK